METFFFRVIEWIPLWFKLYLLIGVGTPVVLVIMEHFLWKGFAAQAFEAGMDLLVFVIFLVSSPLWEHAAHRLTAALKIIRAGEYTPGCV